MSTNLIWLIPVKTWSWEKETSGQKNKFSHHTGLIFILALCPVVGSCEVGVLAASPTFLVLVVKQCPSFKRNHIKQPQPLGSLLLFGGSLAIFSCIWHLKEHALGGDRYVKKPGVVGYPLGNFLVKTFDTIWRNCFPCTVTSVTSRLPCVSSARMIRSEPGIACQLSVQFPASVRSCQGGTPCYQHLDNYILRNPCYY